MLNAAPEHIVRRTLYLSLASPLRISYNRQRLAGRGLIVGLMDQAELALGVEVNAELSDELYALAKEVGTRDSMGAMGLGAPTDGSMGLHFQISKGKRRLAGFDCWVSDVLKDKHGNETTRRMFYVDWDDEIERRIDTIAEKGIVGMLWADRKGIKGFEVYRSFITALKREVVKMDSSASVKHG